VANSRIDGNADNSSGCMMYMLASIITSEMVMLNDKSKSRTTGGKGIIINTRIPTTAAARKISLFFVRIDIGPEYCV
jgi:hypothetical protein